MEYDKEFEEWLKKNYSYLVDREETRVRFYQCWQAARKDHYRIGEEVEARAHNQESFVRGVVTALISVGFAVDQPDNVRRIPAWKPKEGEAVLFSNTFGYAECGCVDTVAARFVTVKTSNGTVFGDDVEYLRPFAADKIGKPWEEI